MKLLDIYKEMKNDLNIIEEELYQVIRTPHSLMQETSSHLLKAGGKRIRPVFVLLGGKYGTYDLELMKHVAVSLELIHMATLVHDDVIDNADTRRGNLTVKSKWDNKMAMYTGDYIFAKALRYINMVENPRVHQILSKSIVELCLGEIEQIKALYNWNQSFKTYFRRIKRKTALLMAISCQLGGVACDASEEVVKALYRYGYYVGMAFQITDDILDFTGTEKELGKPAGSDLLQGNITLPVLASFQDLHVKETIINQFHKSTPADISIITKIVIDSGGVSISKQVARKYLTKAREALKPLGQSKNTETLFLITDFIEQRNF
jgi:heptaprenyl diphosphate synthase